MVDSCPPEVSQQLEKILSSPPFALAERQRRLLKFAVEQAYSGRAEEIKEYTVATELFERPASFDPDTDSSVRVHASRLRVRLEDYYAGLGVDDAILIQIPKGSYVAICETRQARQARQNATSGEPASALSLRALAVLPFQALSPDREDAYFADALTEDLIRTLGSMRQRPVIARSSVQRFKERPQDARRIGEMLGVSAVITGTVRRRGGILRVTVEVADTASGLQFFTQSYDLTDDLMPEMQDELAREIAGALALPAPNVYDVGVGRSRTTTPEAYRHYLRGLNVDFLTRSGLEQSLEEFSLAAAADSGYAPAHYGLGLGYALLALYGHWPPNQAIPEMKRHAARALELDPSMAEPYQQLGYAAATYDWNPAEAERCFRKAIDLNPSCVRGRTGYALFLLAPQGRYQEAMEQINKAIALDPLDPIWPGYQIAAGTYSGRLHEAIESGHRIATPDNREPFAHMFYAVALRQSGRFAEALQEAQQAAEYSRNHPLMLRALGVCLGAAGRRSEALAVLRKIESDTRERYVSPAAIASIYDSIGDRKAAVSWLDRAVAERDPSLIYIRTWILPERYAGFPRVTEILEQVGLRRR